MATTWQRFLKKHKGKGYSIKKLSAMYRKEHGKASRPASRKERSKSKPAKRSRYTYKFTSDERIAKNKIRGLERYFVVKNPDNDKTHAYAKNPTPHIVATPGVSLPSGVKIAKYDGKFLVLYKYPKGYIAAMGPFKTKQAAIDAEFRALASYD